MRDANPKAGARGVTTRFSKALALLKDWALRWPATARSLAALAVFAVGVAATFEPVWSGGVSVAVPIADVQPT